MLAPAYSKPLLRAYSFKPTDSFHAFAGRYRLPLPARTQRCLSPAGERLLSLRAGMPNLCEDKLRDV